MAYLRVSAKTGEAVWVEDDPAGVPPPPTYEEQLAAWRAGREVSRLEMSFALETAGVLSAAEADQFVAFGLPQPLVDLIATLPESDQALARRKMFGATVFPRADPLWDALTASEGWPDDTDVDALFGWEG